MAVSIEYALVDTLDARTRKPNRGCGTLQGASLKSTACSLTQSPLWIQLDRDEVGLKHDYITQDV